MQILAVDEITVRRGHQYLTVVLDYLSGRIVLCILVEQALGLNPFPGDLFVFCNRQHTIVKILYWDKNGFALWIKHLEKHRFKWPNAAEEVILIGPKELEWLLAGLDYTSAHKQLKYSAVA